MLFVDSGSIGQSILFDGIKKSLTKVDRRMYFEKLDQDIEFDID